VAKAEDIKHTEPALVDAERENVFPVLDGKRVRARPDAPEGFALTDTVIADKSTSLNKVYAEAVWGVLLAYESEDTATHCPSPFGANPEAIAQVAAHLSYGDRPFTNRFVKCLASAVSAANADTVRGLFHIAEAQLLIPDALAGMRQQRVWDIMHGWFHGTQPGSPEATIEHLNWLLRAANLAPALAEKYLVKDDTLAFEAEEWLRAAEAEPKFGYGKAPLWAAQIVDAEGRPEVAVAAAAAAAGKETKDASATDRDAAILPLKKYLLSVMAQPNAMTHLSVRDELYITAYLPVSISVRATLLLQRLRRVLAAHGRELLGVAEIARRAEAIRAAKEAAAAAGIAADGSTLPTGAAAAAAAASSNAPAPAPGHAPVTGSADEPD